MQFPKAIEFNPITLDHIVNYYLAHRYTDAKDLVNNKEVAGEIITLPQISKIPNVPELHLSILENTIMVGKYGLLISQQGQLIRESVIYGHIDEAIKGVEIFEISPNNCHYLDGEFLPLCGYWSEGFWHWVMEYIPLILHAKLAGFNGIYVLSADAPQFVIDTIHLLGIDPQQVVLYDGTPWVMKKVWLPRRLPASGNLLIEYPGTLKLLRESLLMGANANNSDLKKRVYISRRDAPKGRRIVNEESLIAMLEHYGFNSVTMSSFTFEEQIKYMANAEVLIGPHGAGMAHCLFMPERSLIIEMFSPQYIAPCMLPVTNLLKHRYHMALPTFTADVYPHGKEIEANLMLIETILKAEILDRRS